VINYLLSGIDREKGFYKLQAKYLNQDIKNTNVITFIVSTFSDIEKIVDIVEPDLTIYVDSTIESTINRMKNRNSVEFDEEYIYKLQTHIHNFYKKYLKRNNTYIIKNNYDKKTYYENIIKIHNFLKGKYINE